MPSGTFWPQREHSTRNMLLWGSFLLPPQESWDLILTISLVDSTGHPFPKLPAFPGDWWWPLIGFWAEGQDPAKEQGAPEDGDRQGWGSRSVELGPQWGLKLGQARPTPLTSSEAGCPEPLKRGRGSLLGGGAGAAWVWGGQPGPTTGLMSSLLLLGLIALFTVTTPGLSPRGSGASEVLPLGRWLLDGF